MKDEKKNGYAWAISAGFNAALAAISAKYFTFQLKYALVVLFNVIMWGCYVNSMKSLSSLQATVTNFATNFLTSGMSGYILFDEALPLKVLSEPKNALCKQYKRMFSMNNVKLEFTDNAMRLIAKKAISRNTGARGLRAILEDILTDAMFEVPDAKSGKDQVDTVLVDEEAVGAPDAPGCGAKLLYSNHRVEEISEQTESRDTSDDGIHVKGSLPEHLEDSFPAMSSVI